MKMMQEKYDEACEEIEACGINIDVLRAEWDQQVQDVTKKAPSMPS